MNWRKIVAREWLILLGCAIVAFVIVLSDPDVLGGTFGYFTLFSYAFVQAVRGTIWAIKTVRRKEPSE